MREIPFRGDINQNIKIMKTFKKPSLPESISHNGSEFTLNTSISSAMHLNNTPISRIAQTLRSEGRKAVVVEVLSRSLKGKTDLHGNPYKPTKWIFTEVEQEMESFTSWDRKYLGKG